MKITTITVEMKEKEKTKKIMRREEKRRKKMGSRVKIYCSFKNDHFRADGEMSRCGVHERLMYIA